MVCGKRAQSRCSFPGRLGVKACCNAHMKQQGVERRETLPPSLACGNPACHLRAQHAVQDGVGKRYCSLECVPGGRDARVVPEGLQCAAGCGQRAQYAVQDGDAKRYCSLECLPGGREERVVPEGLQCAAGCGKPGHYAVQDGDAKRYCSLECLPGGREERVVPEGLQCAAGCGKPGRGSVQDGDAKRYCSLECLPGGREARVVPEGLQCAAGCGKLAQYAVQDGDAKRYCSLECLPGGREERVVPEGLQCAAGCGKLASHRVQDGDDNSYCSVACRPGGRYAAVARFGASMREVDVSPAHRAACAAALFQLPGVREHLAAGYSVDIFAASVPISASPHEALGHMEREFVSIMNRPSAVLQPLSGERVSIFDLRRGGLVLHALGFSRINTTTGGSGVEGILQEMLAKLPRGWRLWSSVNGNGALCAPDKVQVVAAAWLPPNYRDKCRITLSLERYETENADHAMKWTSDMPSSAAVAAQLQALEAANPGRGPWLNLGLLSVEPAWAAFQDMERGYYESIGSPVCPVLEPPDTWDRKLLGAKVLATGWDCSDVADLEARLLTAGAEVIPKGGSMSQHTLLVYNDQWRQHAKLRHAMAQGSDIMVIQRVDFVAHVDQFAHGLAARGSNRSALAGGRNSAAFGVENDEPNSPVKRCRVLVVDDEDEDEDE
jgi:hypothetical protein